MTPASTARLTARGERTRERIVRATADLAFEHGMSRTRLEDIQAAAQVSASQIYHYFPSKDNLLRAVIHEREDDVVGAQERMLADIDSIAGLRAWADHVVDQQRLRYCRGGCPIGTLGAEVAESDADARTEVAGSFERWAAAIGRALRTMQVAGRLAPEASPEDLALAFLAAVQGGLLLGKIQRSTRPLRSVLDAMLDLVERHGGR